MYFCVYCHVTFIYSCKTPDLLITLKYSTPVTDTLINLLIHFIIMQHGLIVTVRMYV